MDKNSNRESVLDHLESGRQPNVFLYAFISLVCLTIVLVLTLMSGDSLGHGYSRRGEYIVYKGRRIDKAGAGNIQKFATIVGHELTLCSNVDAESFKVFSEEYTADKNKVYYKWISGRAFWIVQLPKADPQSFRAVGPGLACDNTYVWVEDTIVHGADPENAESLFGSRVWMDRSNVWSGRRKFPSADRQSFEKISESGFGFYKDKNKVFKYYGSLKILEGADPATFTINKENKSLGQDKNGIWGQDGLIKSN